MRRERGDKPAEGRRPASARGTVALTAVAALAGVFIGVVVVGFRLILQWIDELRVDLAHEAVASGVTGMLAVIAACAACATIASLMVTRIDPHLAGSGMPRVIGISRGQLPVGHWRVLPLKFVSSVLTLGSGMALGRAGPSVQMGGVIAYQAGRIARRDDEELRILAASGASAGLATAFNAPIAGGVFVLEQILRRFDTRATIVTFMSSATGFAAAWFLLGADVVLYRVAPIEQTQMEHVPWVLAVGIAAGAFGVLTNKGFVSGPVLAGRIPGPPALHAAVVGALVGVLVLTVPTWTGVGDILIDDALNGRGTIATIAALLLLRLVASWVCAATSVPGGLFGPIVVLGANLGLLVGLVAAVITPQTAPSPAALAIVGVAALFASTLQAPMTGIAIAFEIAGITTQLVPMMGACALSMMVAILLRDTPLFEALTARAVEG